MSDLKICRACLCKGVKMYNYNQFNLKQYYEQLMDKQVNIKDGLPHHFCYMCAAMLYKYQKFKERCCTGEATLIELLWHGPITITAISQTNRVDKNLQLPIDILTVSERVKTYITKNKSKTERQVKKFKRLQPLVIDVCKEDFDSDNSLDSLENKCLAEIKNEMTCKEDTVEIEKTKVYDEQIITEEKSFQNVDSGDRIFSDDEDFNAENINNLDISEVKDEIRNQEYDDIIIKHNIEAIIDDVEKTPQKNHKERKRKRLTANKHKGSVGMKAKKFEGNSNTNKNELHPNHWLKITLNEEEALEEFRARGQDQYYLSAPYKCTDCLKGFSKEDMLNRHIKLRHSESLGPVECRFCNMRFKWNCYLTRHLSQHYTKYKCLRCDIICPLKNTALFHNDYHNGVTRKCEYCGWEFRHLSTYYTHLRTHRSEHVCTLCGASFVSTMGLKMHKRTMHVNTVVNQEEEVSTYCERCDVKFETRKAYEEHVYHSVKHTEGVEDLPVETVAPPKRKRRVLRRNLRKRTPCTICNRNFPSFAAFTKHHKAEHKDEPLPKEEQRHICEICGASLLANSIATHLNSHTREKTYSCPICLMEFISKASMTRHQVTHTGAKPYKCTLCDKHFTQQCSMKLHYRTFHLKEPYPKRNRRKNVLTQQDIEDFRTDDDALKEKPKRNRWR